jgi:hypothetical protein
MGGKGSGKYKHKQKTEEEREIHRKAYYRYTGIPDPKNRKNYGLIEDEIFEKG